MQVAVDARCGAPGDVGVTDATRIAGLAVVGFVGDVSLDQRLGAERGYFDFVTGVKGGE
jgi:hypothetical protein